MKRERDVDVSTTSDPFACIAAAKSVFESMRDYMTFADDHVADGWRGAMRDPDMKQRALNQLFFAGEILARLTVLVTNPPDELIDEARLDLMETAWLVATTQRASSVEATAEQ